MAASSHVTCLASVLLGEDRPREGFQDGQTPFAAAFRLTCIWLESRHCWQEVQRRTLGDLSLPFCEYLMGIHPLGRGG